MLNFRHLRKRFSTVSKNFIDGEWIEPTGDKFFQSKNPLTQEVMREIRITKKREFNDAVDSSKIAYQTWKNVSIPQRVRFMLEYQKILKDHSEEIAKLITHEHGKTIVDSRGDIFRGIEVVESCASLSSLLQGETIENLATGVDTYSYKQPLGVCAGVCPFNFPAMIPLWMFPLAITCGNTYIFKPSERVSGTAELLIQLLEKTGIPKGVVNLVNGGVETVMNI